MFDGAVDTPLTFIINFERSLETALVSFLLSLKIFCLSDFERKSKASG